MKRIIAGVFAVLLMMTLLIPAVYAEDETEVWTLVTQDGQVLTQIGTTVTVGDEYIAQNNRLYKVVQVDPGKKEAVVQDMGEESAISQAFYEVRKTAVNRKLVGLYCTHSDESYETGDGTSSIESGWAGIHDVASTLKSWLEEKDVDVTFNTGSFLPHDAGAYRRSRVAMTDLVKEGPAAIFDIHRDGIPDASQYQTEINGEPATMVRLLVGRSNPNSSENKQFAKQLKSVADENYPGLIKDIFIGKGNYNQELMPDSVLLEFGTHVSDKEQVLASTKYMADVINITVFGGAAGYSEQPQEQGEQAENPNAAAAPEATDGAPTVTQQAKSTPTAKSGGSGVWKAVGWIVGIVVVGFIAFAAIANGGFSGMGDSVKRFSSEVTGGMFGKKPKK